MSWLLAMTLLVAAIMALPDIYLGWRFKKATGYISSTKILRWLPVILLASFFLVPIAGLIQLLFGINPKITNYSLYLTYWFWLGFVLTFQLLTWVILFDILKLIVKKVTGWPLPKINTVYSYALITAAIVLSVFTAAKMWVDTEQIDIKHIALQSEQIPESLNNFRIVHISDLQADPYTGRQEIDVYINKVNKLNPDLIIFTGDLISYGTDYIDMAAAELAKAKATYGLYAVIGDHDYWAGVQHIKQAYQKYDIPLLQNRNTIISIKKDSLLLTGITEVYSKHISRDSLQKLSSDFKDISFEIMATHQATEKVIEVVSQENYELVLGGHTHGGQIRVPLMFTHISAPSLETDYLSGPYHIGNLLLNINNGLGFTLAPVRYDAQPSISVIDIKAK